MVARDFLFMDKHLEDFGFIMLKPKAEDDSGMAREVLKGTPTAYRSNPVHYGTKYSSQIVLNMFILKYNCDYTNDDMVISPFELRDIQRWLTSSKLPESLYIITQEGTMIEYKGIFTDIVPYSYYSLNGITLQFTCDSPFAYETREVKVKQADAKNGVQKKIYCDTDELEEYVYPLIQYYPKSSGAISLKNATDNNNEMTLTLNSSYSEVVIDCKLKRVIADGTPLPLSSLGWNITEITDYNNINTGIFKMYWLRLMPKRNYVTVKGNGDFIITYQNLLKLGGLINV